MEFPPISKGFRPMENYNRNIDMVFMEMDEYEAIKLCDFEGLNQEEAASVMGVSRPTLTRIYASARKKIASVLVENRPLLIQGGKVSFDDKWFRCDSCNTVYNDVTHGLDIKCPKCGSVKYSAISEESSDFHPRKSYNSTRKGFCKCGKCGSRFSLNNVKPCFDYICPSCQFPMKLETIEKQIVKEEKWAISCIGNTLSAPFNTRFGRSPFFAILQNDEITFIVNPFSSDSVNAGIKTINFLLNLGVTGLVSDYYGDNVSEVIRQNKIQIFQIEQNEISVNEVINILKSNYYAK